MLTETELKQQLHSVLAEAIKTGEPQQIYFDGKVLNIHLAPDPCYLADLQQHTLCNKIPDIETINDFKVTQPSS